MKTTTRPAAGAERPAASFRTLRAGRTHLANRLGRSSQVSWLWWGLAGGSVATVGLLTPTIVPWLLLPVVPAILLRAAGCQGSLRCGRRMLRLFLGATLVAVAFQLVAARPTFLEIGAPLLATVLFLLAVERLAFGERIATDVVKPLG